MDFHDEEMAVLENFGTIIGVDEVGRGSLAGPICASACIVTPIQKSLIQLRDIQKIPIRDSKKLSRQQRERTFTWLRENFQASFIRIEPKEIDRNGIQNANNEALNMALQQAVSVVQSQEIVCFVDHFKVQKPQGVSRIMSMAHGDSLYVSVACASIWAKVMRDTYMTTLSSQYPQYKWETNMGYGTQEHRDALKKFGISPHHRRSFLTKMQSFYSK